MNNSTVSFKEIRITVPWGHIAAKEWGNPDAKHHVLALHGWQDSAASFDLLIPLLSRDLHIVAVDLPGHGLSSHRPRGVPYHLFDWVVDVHRIIDHLKWNKFSMIGHSLGLGISLTYAACFPEKVLKIIGLDQLITFLRVFILSLDDLANRMATAIGQVLQSEKPAAAVPRPIDFDTAVQVVMTTMEGSMTKEAVIVQMKRGYSYVGNTGKVALNKDPRLWINQIPGVDMAQLKALAKSVHCEILILAADRGPVLGSVYASASPKEEAELLDIYRREAKFFKMLTVPGTHHVHLNNPAVVAPHINEFFQSA